MTITNVKLVTRCPKCLAKGTVIGHRNNLLLLECRDCNKRWNTYSKTCKVCGKPNYFFVEGPCVKCYSEKHNAV